MTVPPVVPVVPVVGDRRGHCGRGRRSVRRGGHAQHGRSCQKGRPTLPLPSACARSQLRSSHSPPFISVDRGIGVLRGPIRDLTRRIRDETPGGLCPYARPRYSTGRVASGRIAHPGRALTPNRPGKRSLEGVRGLPPGRRTASAATIEGARRGVEVPSNPPRHGSRSARGRQATSGVISAAGLILAAIFAALAVMSLLYVAQIGCIVAIGVLDRHSPGTPLPRPRPDLRPRPPHVVADTPAQRPTLPCAAARQHRRADFPLSQDRPIRRAEAAECRV
ncbi:MMPL family transporter [Streptomyces sp. NPDC088762]|uniref:MMPL family transporter n=1 Tax=Streptomyces sp. NPDC088762 TaxID=3365891 RepID=UPI00381482F5